MTLPWLLRLNGRDVPGLDSGTSELLFFVPGQTDDPALEVGRAS